VALAALLAAALAVALYWSTSSFEFVNWDDWEYVLLNPHLGALDLEFARWSFTLFHANWHPATLWSYGLDYALWERDPGGYHLTNVLLHGANSGLAVWLAWRLFRRHEGATKAALFGAAFVGLVFASHPLHVESVAWISERKDVLYGLFFLASLIAWTAYVDPQADRRHRRIAYGLALGAFTLSALSKPMAVTLPLVLWILDVYPFRRLTRRSDILPVGIVEKLPFFAISLVTSVLTLQAQSARGAIGMVDLPFTDRLWVAMKALAFYLGQWVAPITLIPFHPLDPEIDPTRWPYWTALLALCAILVTALTLRRRIPSLAAALAFTTCTLLPVLGIIEIGYQSAADRYMYIPMLGPTVLAGAAATAAWRRSAPTRWIAVALSVLALLFLSWRTLDQIPVWRNSTSLWRHVVAHYPGSALAHYNLGHAHAIAGRPAGAQAEWKASIEIDPAYTPALYELGAAAGRNGDYAEALRYFETAIAADPSHARARINLAMVLENLGNWQGAAQHYREFIRTASPAFSKEIEFARARLDRGGAGDP
jgi:hypothetical protein